MFLNLVALFVLSPLRTWWTLKEDPAESSSNLGLTLPPLHQRNKRHTATCCHAGKSRTRGLNPSCYLAMGCHTQNAPRIRGSSRCLRMHRGWRGWCPGLCFDLNRDFNVRLLNWVSDVRKKTRNASAQVIPHFTAFFNSWKLILRLAG